MSVHWRHLVRDSWWQCQEAWDSGRRPCRPAGATAWGGLDSWASNTVLTCCLGLTGAYEGEGLAQSQASPQPEAAKPGAHTTMHPHTHVSTQPYAHTARCPHKQAPTQLSMNTQPFELLKEVPSCCVLVPYYPSVAHKFQVRCFCSSLSLSKRGQKEFSVTGAGVGEVPPREEDKCFKASPTSFPFLPPPVSRHREHNPTPKARQHLGSMLKTSTSFWP